MPRKRVRLYKEMELPPHLRELFARVPLLGIGDDADLSERAVKKMLKLLDADVEKFKTLKA